MEQATCQVPTVGGGRSRDVALGIGHVKLTDAVRLIRQRVRRRMAGCDDLPVDLVPSGAGVTPAMTSGTVCPSCGMTWDPRDASSSGTRRFLYRARGARPELQLPGHVRDCRDQPARRRGRPKRQLRHGGSDRSSLPLAVPSRL